MTTEQIARLFKARKAGRGKWMAKCSVHRDRMASLEIKAGKKPGSTIVGCYAGCDKVAVLAAVGLRLCDLFADTKPDREALALAEKMRAEAGRKRMAKKRQWRKAIEQRRCWKRRHLSLSLGIYC